MEIKTGQHKHINTSNDNDQHLLTDKLNIKFGLALHY